MTDREVYEHLYRHYERPAAAEAVADYDRARVEAEAAFAAKPLDERKREFWDLCKSYGCQEADIRRQWDAYLRGES